MTSGEFGRFGNQLNAIPMLLERPFGFGPLQFGQIFGLDPHNVYLNAFGSYGWLGGISYMLLILSTIIVGFKGVLIRTPWQGQTIALFCAFFATALQGVQIDTDHWRHFYWMLGLVWGFYAASAAWSVRQHRLPRPQVLNNNRTEKLMIDVHGLGLTNIALRDDGEGVLVASLEPAGEAQRAGCAERRGTGAGCSMPCRAPAIAPWCCGPRARISAPGSISSSITARIAGRPSSCTCACAGTRRSTRWNMAACRSSPR